MVFTAVFGPHLHHFSGKKQFQKSAKKRDPKRFEMHTRRRPEGSMTFRGRKKRENTGKLPEEPTLREL